MTNHIHLIGGGTVGRRITDRLEHRGDSVVVIEYDEEKSNRLEADGYRVYHGDGTDLEILEDAGVGRADVVVVATADDDTNLLAAQLVRNRFDPGSVIARVNRPENEEPFQELGIKTVSRADATAQMLDSHIESPALTQWMETIGQEGDVQEIAVQNPELVGSRVSELDGHLPERVLLCMIGREGEAHLPDREETIESGDHVTVIGARDAVRAAMEELTGETLAEGESSDGERARQRE